MAHIFNKDLMGSHIHEKKILLLTISRVTINYMYGQVTRRGTNEVSWGGLVVGVSNWDEDSKFASTIDYIKDHEHIIVTD